MSKTAGRQVNVGIAVEYAPGTPKTPTHFPQWTDFSMQAVSEKSQFRSARGQRYAVSNSMIRRKLAQGSVGVVPNVENAPYFFLGALGKISSATASGETIVYEHTITPEDNNANTKAFTLVSEEGSIVTERYSNVVFDSLNLEVSDDYAQMTAELIGQYPTSSTLTESFTKETEFSYQDMTVKFGSTLTAAAAAGATPLKSFSLNIACNTQLDEAFLSGSNGIAAGGLLHGPLEVTGNYSLHFSDTTELNKYKNNTREACIVSFLGAAIGVAETEEIKIKLGRLILTDAPREYNIDGLLVLNQGFTVEMDSTDGSIAVIVTNKTVGTTYAPTS